MRVGARSLKVRCHRGLDDGARRPGGAQTVEDMQKDIMTNGPPPRQCSRASCSQRWPRASSAGAPRTRRAPRNTTWGMDGFFKRAAATWTRSAGRPRPVPRRKNYPGCSAGSARAAKVAATHSAGVNWARPPANSRADQLRAACRALRRLEQRAALRRSATRSGGAVRGAACSKCGATAWMMCEKVAKGVGGQPRADVAREAHRSSRSRSWTRPFDKFVVARAGIARALARDARSRTPRIAARCMTFAERGVKIRCRSEPRLTQKRIDRHAAVEFEFLASGIRRLDRARCEERSRFFEISHGFRRRRAPGLSALLKRRSTPSRRSAPRTRRRPAPILPEQRCARNHDWHAADVQGRRAFL